MTNPHTHKCKACKIHWCTHTHSKTEDSFKDTHKPIRGLLASGLRGICWTARDCVMAAPPPPVSCVCAVTGWEGWGGGGSTEEDSLCIKEPEKKEHVNLLNKAEGRRERKEGARARVETITFSFVQVFLCVHTSVKEREKRRAVWRVDDTDKLNDIKQISWVQICFLLWFNFLMICIYPSATANTEHVCVCVCKAESWDASFMDKFHSEKLFRFNLLLSLIFILCHVMSLYKPPLSLVILAFMHNMTYVWSCNKCHVHKTVTWTHKWEQRRIWAITTKIQTKPNKPAEDRQDV